MFLGDIFIVIFSLYAAFSIRWLSLVSFSFLSERAVFFVFLLCAYPLSFYIFDLYNPQRKYKTIRSFSLLLAALALVTGFAAVFFYIFPFTIGRGVFFINLIIIGILVFIWRLIYSLFFRLAVVSKQVLIIGTGKPAQELYSLIESNRDYNVIGFFGSPPKEKEFLGLNYFKKDMSIEKIISDYKTDLIISTTKLKRNKKLNKVLVKCKMEGISVISFPTFYEELMRKLPISYISESWFLNSSGFGKLGNIIYNRLKRVIDLSIALILLILFFPLGLVIALVIKLSSKGPILYMQERLGENKESFIVIKFRTMVTDAEKEGPKWADDNDSRITKVGKILRRTRLDEIPQLINVIKGKMSLVGPRPEREYFVKVLEKKIPFYSLRFYLKPGLTGWAQINYKYGSSLEDAEEKLQYELYYIKNMSLFLDTRIILKTIKTSLFGIGH